MAKKILIIEDYPATSRLIADVLAMEGLESIIAGNAADGLQKAEKEKPAVILLDLMLPGMDGLEACARLKAKPETKEIPIIIVSVKASDDDIRAGLKCGAQDYLTKPFDPFKLTELVKKYLSGGRER